MKGKMQLYYDMGIQNCIIIDGCPSYSDKSSYDTAWRPWIKQELISHGIKTENPYMFPQWDYKYYEKFKVEFEKYDIDENTVLIGHSCGAAFLVRWLGETKRKASKLILVAPWKIPSDFVKKNFYDFPISKNIKERVKEIIFFTSDNEEDEGKESLKMFHDLLGGKIIELKDHGHYTDKFMGAEFPELLKVILE